MRPHGRDALIAPAQTVLLNTNETWGSVAKAFHWTMALLIFAQFALGWIAVSLKLSPSKLTVFVWHKSIGILLLTLAAARVMWRLANPAPALPPGTPPWERAAARASHALLYCIMIAMPISGWVINSASNIPFRVFWLFPLPAITAPDKALSAVAKGVHFGFFLALAAILILHIGAALRHHYVNRNSVLIRMLPGGGGRS